MKKYLFNVIQYIKFVNITFRKKLEIPEPNLEKKNTLFIAEYSLLLFIIERDLSYLFWSWKGAYKNWLRSAIVASN